MVNHASSFRQPAHELGTMDNCLHTDVYHVHAYGLSGGFAELVIFIGQFDGNMIERFLCWMLHEFVSENNSWKTLVQVTPLPFLL